MSNLKQRKRSRRAPQPTFTVMIACNGDDGIFEGRCEGISFSAAGESIDLELTGGRPPRFKELEDGIRIFRQNFIVLRSASCVGNWCWNSYTLTIEASAKILSLALDSGLFTCTGASGDNACRLSDAIDEDAPLGELQLYMSLFGSDRT